MLGRQGGGGGAVGIDDVRSLDDRGVMAVDNRNERTVVFANVDHRFAFLDQNWRVRGSVTECAGSDDCFLHRERARLLFGERVTGKPLDVGLGQAGHVGGGKND